MVRVSGSRWIDMGGFMLSNASLLAKWVYGNLEPAGVYRVFIIAQPCIAGKLSS